MLSLVYFLPELLLLIISKKWPFKIIIKCLFPTRIYYILLIQFINTLNRISSRCQLLGYIYAYESWEVMTWIDCTYTHVFEINHNMSIHDNLFFFFFLPTPLLHHLFSIMYYHFSTYFSLSCFLFLWKDLLNRSKCNILWIQNQSFKFYVIFWIDSVIRYFHFSPYRV